ncbi:MAG: MBL fold metallo-hydrolase [Anaerolineaceae bacterium]
MTSTTTDRFTKKQAQIDQQIKQLIDSYPSLWNGMIADWKTNDPTDAGWLMYSANYLFRTTSVRWAVDPLSLHWRIPAAPQLNLKKDLQDLSFVLLTHDHKDHLDLELIRELRDYPIQWVVPAFMVEKILRETGLPTEKMIVPNVMQPLNFNGLTVTPFEGQHLLTFADGTSKGVPELGYLVECAGKRWLFPGDTRVYDVSRLPEFGKVDLLFAHLWLGHGAALQNFEQNLNVFCQFCADLQPDGVILTHLQEFGRDANDFFDEEHAKKIKRIFTEKYPSIHCSSLLMGEKVLL